MGQRRVGGWGWEEAPGLCDVSFHLAYLQTTTTTPTIATATVYAS